MSATLSVIAGRTIDEHSGRGSVWHAAHGISASGPMDRGCVCPAGALAGGGQGGIEFTMAGLEIRADAADHARSALPVGDFTVRLNGERVGLARTYDACTPATCSR